MSNCDYCGGPVTGAGHAGRPWPGRPAARYCCYGCLSLGEHRQSEATSSPAPSGWKLDGVGLRLGVGVLVVGQSMIFGLALNLHDDVPAGVRWVAQSMILCATLLVVALLGGPLLRSAARELRRGRLTLESLFLLTMGGAMAASLQAHGAGRGAIYYEVVSVLLVVYTLGKVIGARSRAAALAGSRGGAGHVSVCRVVGSAGEARTVPVAEVRLGDVVEVYPGETIAVDGVIRDGIGFVSEAVVSGEPFPVVRRPGDRVLAGAASHDATFRILATAPGTDRQIDRLLAAVDDARSKPLALQSQADRLGRVFFPLVVVVAVGTFAYWSNSVGWEVGLFSAMSVLLVACPCVIGLATPVIVWSALGRLAERGLIVRSGDAVERLAAVDRVMFDKTGTLTDDRFTLVDVATAATGDERATILGWLSLVEAQSSHPVAKPFAALLRPFATGRDPLVVSLHAVAGCGLEVEIEEVTGARHRLQVGRPDWVAQFAGPTSLPPVVAAGHRIHVAIDGELAAVAVVAERLRDSVPEALAGFARLGLPVEVLTGDSPDRAAALALPPTRAGLRPEDKRAAVAGGRPLFVGDGINDAAALAAAHVGVALASGTDLAVGAADITLYHGDLRALPWAVELSRRTVKAVRRSLCRAVAYNVIGMTLAACGVLHPVVAAVLMVVSSLTLLFSATRVGGVPDHCADPGSGSLGGLTPPARRALTHGLALAAQGFVLLLLLPAAREPLTATIVLGSFALLGCTSAYLWHPWASIPHAIDMCFGMLTAGTLGMLLGWWADLGFNPVVCASCCSCGDPLAKPGMWLGMLLAANAAMLWLGRRPLPRGPHRTAMFTGGNLGMLAGMWAGGAAVSVLASDLTTGFVLHLVGMTVGMLAGMLLGTRAAERLAAVRRGDSVLSRWRQLYRLMK